MIITAIDERSLYAMKITKEQWSDSANGDLQKLNDVICFQLDDILSDCKNSSDSVFEETTFIMSIEDARHLKAFLDISLAKL